MLRIFKYVTSASHVKDSRKTQPSAQRLAGAVDFDSFKGFVGTSTVVLEASVGRPEIQFLLLLGDYVYSRESTGLLGRAVVVANGASVLNWAWRRGLSDPSSAWADHGVDAKSHVVSWFSLFCFGLSGLRTMYAGFVGPEKDPLSVLSLGVEKLALVSQLLYHVKANPSLNADAKLNGFMKSQMRSGTILVVLSGYLLWRRRRASFGAPSYAREMEERLSAKLDKLHTAAKDQRSILAGIRGTPATPTASYSPRTPSRE